MRAFVSVEGGGPVPAVDAPAVPPAPTHLTLEFLGDLPEARVPAIVSALRAVGPRVPPFSITLEGVGAFPSRASPRVVWLGVTEGRVELSALAREVAAALEALGIPRPREPFVPHLTLFRVRSAADRERARQWLDGAREPPAPRTVPVVEFRLKESTLAPSGPVHRTVEQFPLGALASGSC